MSVLLLLQIVFAVIASMRGWKAWPAVVLVGLYFIGYYFMTTGPLTEGVYTFLKTLDFMGLGLLIGMCFNDKRKKSSKST